MVICKMCQDLSNALLFTDEGDQGECNTQHFCLFLLPEIASNLREGLDFPQ